MHKRVSNFSISNDSAIESKNKTPINLRLDINSENPDPLREDS